MTGREVDKAETPNPALHENEETPVRTKYNLRKRKHKDEPDDKGQYFNPAFLYFMSLIILCISLQHSYHCYICIRYHFKL